MAIQSARMPGTLSLTRRAVQSKERKATPEPFGADVLQMVVDLQRAWALEDAARTRLETCQPAQYGLAQKELSRCMLVSAEAVKSLRESLKL
jgi:hypothetical protein